MPGLFGAFSQLASTIGKNLPTISSGLQSVFAPQASAVSNAERQAAQSQSVRPGLSRAQIQAAAVAGGVGIAGIGAYATYRHYKSKKSRGGSKGSSRRSF